MDIKDYRSIVIRADYANQAVKCNPVTLSANDHDGRIIRFVLTDGGKNVPNTGLSARLLFNAAIYDPNSSGGWVTMTAVSGTDTATWEVPVPSDALVPGEVAMAVAVYQGETQVCTRNFTARVEAQILNANAPEAKNALNEFYDAINKVDTAAEDAAQAVTNANTALATANQTIAKVQADTKDAIDAATVATSKAENAADDASEAMQGITAATVLRAGNYLVGEVDASPLAHVEDAWPSPVGELAIYGESRQNLWKNPIGSSGGITAISNADGSCTVSGTATVNAASVASGRIFSIVAGNTYTLSVDKVLGDDLTTFRVNFYNSNNDVTRIFSLGTDTSVTFTAADGDSYMICVVRAAVGASLSGTYRVMLNEGAEPAPWCAPGIESVECGEVVAAGRNLVDPTQLALCVYSRDVPIKTHTKPTLPYEQKSNTEGIGVVLGCRAGVKYTCAYCGPSPYGTAGISEYAKKGDVYNYAKAIGHVAAGTKSPQTYTAKGDGWLVCMVASKWTTGGVSNLVTFDASDIAVCVGDSAEWSAYNGSTSDLSMPDGSPVTLRSLPDGTRDEVVWTEDGGRELVRRVEHLVVDGITRKFIPSTGKYAVASLSKEHDCDSSAKSRSLCDSLPTTNGVNRSGFIWFGMSRNLVAYSYSADIADVNALNAIASARPIVIDYALLTPEVIPLTSSAAPRLPESTSNVWATSESDVQPDVSLSYQVDVNIEHARQNKRISDLEAVVNGLAVNALEV